MISLFLAKKPLTKNPLYNFEAQNIELKVLDERVKSVAEKVKPIDLKTENMSLRTFPKPGMAFDNKTDYRFDYWDYNGIIH